MSEVFLNHLFDLLRDLGPVETRPMFGGVGLYHERQPFALFVDDQLYLKAEGELREVFEDRGLECFTCNRDGQTMHLNYYHVPAEAFRGPREMLYWVRRALNTTGDSRAA